MIKEEPRITVLMSVYNAEMYLDECIKSILNQTYSNFNLFIIDDSSTDSSIEIINSYSDERICLTQNEVNIGLTNSLNNAVKDITTEFIARMDADDVCLENRLLKQLNFLDKNIDCGMVGSSAYKINNSSQDIGEILVPNENLKEQLFFNNTFIHSSIMIRTDVVKKYLYNDKLKYAQDYYLWIKIAQSYNIANIKEKLIKYRIHEESVSINNNKEQINCVLPTINHQLKLLGIVNEYWRNKYTNVHVNYFIRVNKNLSFKSKIWVIYYFRLLLKLNSKNKSFNKYFDYKLIGLINNEKEEIIYSIKMFLKIKLIKFYFRKIKNII